MARWAVSVRVRAWRVRIFFFAPSSECVSTRAYHGIFFFTCRLAAANHTNHTTPPRCPRVSRSGLSRDVSVCLCLCALSLERRCDASLIVPPTHARKRNGRLKFEFFGGLEFFRSLISAPTVRSIRELLPRRAHHAPTACQAHGEGAGVQIDERTSQNGALVIFLWRSTFYSSPCI